MHKVVVQIRDLDQIEKELQSSYAGILALNLTNEKLIQHVTPYVYKDKNIFIFFGEENEIVSNIHFDTVVSFTVMRNGKVRKTKGMDFDPTYNIFSITIRGVVRKVDDSKLADDLRLNYIQKYKKTSSNNINLSALSNIIIIDTEEIQALEETGG